MFYVVTFVNSLRAKKFLNSVIYRETLTFALNFSIFVYLLFTRFGDYYCYLFTMSWK